MVMRYPGNGPNVHVPHPASALGASTPKLPVLQRWCKSAAFAATGKNRMEMVATEPIKVRRNGILE